MWLTFLLRFLTVTLTVLLFWIFSYVPDLVFVLVFLLRNCDHVIVSVSIGFPSNSKMECPFWLLNLWIFCADRDSLHDYLRDTRRGHVFKLSASGAATEFCEWVLVIYIIYPIFHANTWFPAARSVVTSILFCIYMLYSYMYMYIYLIDLICQKLGSCDFWQIANRVLKRGKPVTPPLHLIKQNCLLKTFLRTLMLMTQVISLYLLSLRELIRNDIILL